MKELILVFGPRSSGTRFFSELLIRSGAVGDSDNSQRLDALSGFNSGYKAECSREDSLELIQGEGYAVLRRSIPHGSGFPYPDQEISDFSKLNCSLAITFWMQRDIHAAASSMLKIGHERDYHRAIGSIVTAYRLFLMGCGPFIPVTYELLGEANYVQKLYEIAGVNLTCPSDTNFVNGNAKHYALPLPEAAKAA